MYYRNVNAYLQTKKQIFTIRLRFCVLYTFFLFAIGAVSAYNEQLRGYSGEAAMKMKRMVAAGILFICSFGMLGVGLGLLISGMFSVFAKRKPTT